MKRVLYYFLVFLMTCTVFRSAVLRRSDPVDYKQYVVLVDTIDGNFDDFVQSCNNYASSWNNTIVRSIQNANLPDWLENFLTWLLSAFSDVQEWAFYSIGLVRYPVIAVSVLFKFFFM